MIPLREKWLLLFQPVAMDAAAHFLDHVRALVGILDPADCVSMYSSFEVEARGEGWKDEDRGIDEDRSARNRVSKITETECNGWMTYVWRNELLDSTNLLFVSV